MKEEWRDIEGFNGKYQVSNLGRVRNTNYYGKVREVSQHIHKKYKGKDNGYLSVTLGKKSYLVHRLVALAFISNDDIFKTDVDHINTIKSDNRVENLRWVTPKENSNNPITLSRHNNNIGKPKPIIAYDTEGNYINSYASISKASKDLGVCTTCIKDVLYGYAKQAKGYVWRYA